MTIGTINELYEYRLINIIKGVLEHNKLKPETTDELFDFLEGRGAEDFAKAVVTDMVGWDDEENWFAQVTK